MKKIAALSLVLMFLFAGIGHAESKGVNLMEFARRYYHAMDIVGAETVEPSVLDDDTPNVVFGYTAVDYDELLNVTKIVVVATTSDNDGVLSLFSVLIALSTSYDEIDENSFSVGLLEQSQFGDYEVTSATSTDTGLIAVLELK